MKNIISNIEQFDWYSTSALNYFLSLNKFAKIENKKLFILGENTIYYKGISVNDNLGTSDAPANIVFSSDKNKNQLNKNIKISFCRTNDHNLVLNVLNNCNEITVNKEYHLFINLTKNLDVLKSNLRTSYKSLINKQENIYVIKDAEIDDVVAICRDIHFRVSGRYTRPIDSWLRMSDSLKKNNAMLVIKKNNNEIIGYTFFFLNENNAYYASSAIIDRKGAHPLIWRAIIELKKKGLKKLFIDNYISLENDDLKINGIRKFKKGFGPEKMIIYLLKKNQNE